MTFQGIIAWGVVEGEEPRPPKRMISRGQPARRHRKAVAVVARKPEMARVGKNPGVAHMVLVCWYAQCENYGNVEDCTENSKGSLGKQAVCCRVADPASDRWQVGMR